MTGPGGATLRAGLLSALLGLAGCGRPAERVVVGLPSAPAGPQPYGTVEEFTNSILSNVYEPLVELDADLGLHPGLAESWHTPDDRTWVFTLRPGVILHDGRSLDAAMVAASIRRARDDPGSKRRAELAPVLGIEALDPRTVVLRTDRPLGTMACRLASIPVAVAPENGAGPETGSGPYSIRRWTQGAVLLERFARYRRGPARVAELEFRVLPDLSERVAGLRRRRLNLVFDLPPADLVALEGTSGLRVLRAGGLRVLFLGVRCAPRLASGDPNPLADARVRRALALAIDRRELVRGPLAGTAEVIDQVIAPGVVGYHDRLASTPYDPEAAAALLAEAGVSGFEVELDYMPAKYRAMDVVVEALAADLEKVGIRIRPREREPGEFFARIEQRQPSLYLLGWMSTNGDAALTYEYLLHTATGGMGVGNGGEYADPVLDRLLDEASARLETADREAALEAVAERVHETLPVIPLYSQKELYALSADLEFHPRLDRRIRGYDLAWRR